MVHRNHISWFCHTSFDTKRGAGPHETWIVHPHCRHLVFCLDTLDISKAFKESFQVLKFVTLEKGMDPSCWRSQSIAITLRAVMLPSRQGLLLQLETPGNGPQVLKEPSSCLQPLEKPNDRAHHHSRQGLLHFEHSTEVESSRSEEEPLLGHGQLRKRKVSLL